MSEKAVKVIAVSGGKGGVGKTNVSVNISCQLAKKGKSVMLFDADLGTANVDILLGVKAKYDLSDVVSGERSLKDVICEGPNGIKIIPASSGVGRMANLSVEEQANLIRSFSDLDDPIDVMIIDTAAGISNTVVSFTKASQEIVVVVCDEPASITDAYALIKVLSKEHNVKNFKILANMVKDATHGKRLYTKIADVADQFLDVSLGYLGSVPMDEKVRQSVQERTAVVNKYPGSPSAIAFGQIADKIDEMAPKSVNTGNLEFFIERLVAQEESQIKQA